MTALFGCGPTYVTDPPNAAGVCTWTASYLITATPGGSAEFVTEGTRWANLTENGSPVEWYPSVSYTKSPTNGTAPLNVTVNLTASNGLAPYEYWWAIFGTSSAAANRTFYPTVSGNASGWNGTNLSLAFPLTRDGIYFVALTVVDSELNPVFLYPAVVTVGVALAPVPLGVVASENGVSTAGPNSSVVQIVANVSGGAGPYTLQWAFGDGTYGSSTPGVAVDHSYRGAGTSSPIVTVTDRLGATDTTALPAVTVRATGDGEGGNHSARGATNPPAGGGSGAPGLSLSRAGSAGVDVVAHAIAVAALVLVGLAVYRTEQLRAAERFVRTLDADSDGFRRGPPPGA
ncbi:MAG: PKD domain-containing protein [Thermoplasmata archaeon]|nr:PKD domain-containing protein [Thermoplasmata archaeon]